MIELSRFDGSTFYVNPDLIEFLEACPDTVITLTNDKKVIVREHPQEIIERIVRYRRRLLVPRIRPVEPAS